jgi:hypothetical protein
MRGVRSVYVGKYRLIFRFTRNILYVYGPQFNTAELDVVSVFEDIFDITLVQFIVDEINKYAQQEISKSI